MPTGSDGGTSPSVVIAASVASADLDGRVVLYDERSGLLAVLDDVGSAVWRALGGVATVDELVQALAIAFEEPVSQVREGVEALLEQLSEQQFIDVRDGSSTG